jgi:hypothetical protein
VHEREVLRVDVALHLAAEVLRLHVRVPEVNPRPDASSEDLVRSENLLKYRLSRGCVRSIGKRLLVA